MLVGVAICRFLCPQCEGNTASVYIVRLFYLGCFKFVLFFFLFNFIIQFVVARLSLWLLLHPTYTYLGSSTILSETTFDAFKIHIIYVRHVSGWYVKKIRHVHVFCPEYKKKKSNKIRIMHRLIAIKIAQSSSMKGSAVVSVFLCVIFSHFDSVRNDDDVILSVCWWVNRVSDHLDPFLEFMI